MTIDRQRFDISTPASGAFVDTGPMFSGMVVQIRYNFVDMDTGAGLKLELVNSGAVIYDSDNVGGTSWTRAPRILSYDTGGAAVGDQYPIGAHDRLRLTAQDTGTGAAGGTTGTVYVWTAW